MNTRIMAIAVVLVAVCLLTTLTTGLTAQPLQQETLSPGAKLSDKIAPHKKTDVPPTAQAQGGLMWFTDPGEFQVFSTGEGNVLKGIENFEESILPPNSLEVFDDPLQSGVPNAPDGFPFPVGMTGLPNLIVQSNLGGGDPSDENPHGVDGLVAVSAGFFGAVSDIVIANDSNDSLDLIFTDEKSGVGFNPISIGGAQAVEVRVYSTTNVFLGMMTTPADPSGANFIGVWSPDPIGRINIFDPGAGFEGADNIQAWEDLLSGGLIWLTDQAAFVVFNSGGGNVLKGIEDFEESILVPGQIDFFDDPLQSGVPNAPDGNFFPEGMTGLPNLRVQSNIGGGNSMDENPQGFNGLATVSAPNLGVVSDVVLATTLNSLDLIFTDDKTAIGFNPISIQGANAVEVRVYSTTNVFLGMMTTPADPTGANFIGVFSTEPIGRVNVFDPGNGAEGGDNIQAWGPGTPSCPADLDGNGTVNTADLLELFANWGVCDK